MDLCASSISTGDKKYFTVALAFFNYVWNWNNPAAGVTTEFNQTQTRDQMGNSLTRLCRQNFPEYCDAIP